MDKTFQAASLSTLMLPREGKRRRASSYDRTGGNDDRIYIKPGETAAFADLKCPGMITHIWITMMNHGFDPEPHGLRKVALEFYWDNEETPSVQAPIGDFFGMGHAQSKNYVSAPLQMSPEDGKGFNCWFPMPFRERALLTVKNEGDCELAFYFYVDYEEYAAPKDELLYFHAQWRRECPTDGRPESEFASHADWCLTGDNRTGAGNYVLMEAKGRGHYVGANINIHNLSQNNLWDWPGEGDDMIFIDGEAWPPDLHGTGTEDYVNMAWCPSQEYCAPYHGLLLGGKDNWKGKITYYRYHIQDPVMFESSIRVTIEHGHDNHRNDDWSSTAYWYQTEPHLPFPPLPPVGQRLPVDEEALSWGTVRLGGPDEKT